MERRFQYYLPFTNHTQYIYIQGWPGPGSIIIIMMQKLILNYTRLHEHTLFNSYISMNASCVRMRIYIEDMRTKKVSECAVTSERIVFS